MTLILILILLILILLILILILLILILILITLSSNTTHPIILPITLKYLDERLANVRIVNHAMIFNKIVNLARHFEKELRKGDIGGDSVGVAIDKLFNHHLRRLIHYFKVKEKKVSHVDNHYNKVT